MHVKIILEIVGLGGDLRDCTVKAQKVLKDFGLYLMCLSLGPHGNIVCGPSINESFTRKKKNINLSDNYMIYNSLLNISFHAWATLFLKIHHSDIIIVLEIVIT